MSENTGSAERDSPGQDADGPMPPATPRWVKITGAVLALLVVAIVVKLAFGGGVGGHGPGGHGGMGATSLSDGPSGVGAPVLLGQ